MKCPTCSSSELASARRSGIDVELCPACKGMWLSPKELEQLEDEVFDFGDNEKGSLMLGDEATAQACPQCAKPMHGFQYRLFDLAMDFCPDGHGFWLTADEDQRVLELMKKEEKDLERKTLAEDQWTYHMRYLSSGGFLNRLRDLSRKLIDHPF